MGRRSASAADAGRSAGGTHGSRVMLDKFTAPSDGAASDTCYSFSASPRSQGRGLVSFEIDASVSPRWHIGTPRRSNALPAPVITSRNPRHRPRRERSATRQSVAGSVERLKSNPAQICTVVRPLRVMLETVCLWASRADHALMWQRNSPVPSASLQSLTLYRVSRGRTETRTQLHSLQNADYGKID